MIGIYKITSPSGSVYIGQSANLDLRRNYYKRLKCKKQPRLYNSLKKYGWEKHKFEILTECLIDELNNLERYYQDLYSCTGLSGLNCQLVNANDRRGQLSQESRKKISISRIGKKTSLEVRQRMVKSRLETYSKMTPEERSLKFGSQRGKKLNEKQLAGLRVVGRKNSPEAIEKYKEKRKTWKLSREQLKNFHNAWPGSKHTEETKAHLRKINLGRKMKSEDIEKLKANRPNARIVINLETGIYYDKIKDASVAYNLNYSTLKQKTKGSTKNNTKIIYA